MRNRTERIGADHVEHRLNYFATEDITENGRVFDATTFAESSEKSLKLLYSPNSVDTNPTETLLTLILVGTSALFQRRITLLKDEQAVVGKIPEVDAKCFEELILFILEEVFILLNKLSDDVCEQGERIR